jgi:hypothetical protein
MLHWKNRLALVMAAVVPFAGLLGCFHGHGLHW